MAAMRAMLLVLAAISLSARALSGASAVRGDPGSGPPGERRLGANLSAGREPGFCRRQQGGRASPAVPTAPGWAPRSRLGDSDSRQVVDLGEDRLGWNKG